MAVFQAEITEIIKLVGSLKAKGEEEVAATLGRKLLSELSGGKDGYLFPLCYDIDLVDASDVTSLMDMVYLSKLLEAIYVQLKTITGGSRADYWFKSGPNNDALQRFFGFIARDAKFYHLESDATLFADVLRTLKGDFTYTIPTSLSSFTLDRFLNGLCTHEIKVQGDHLR